jgi:hypothetical protein
MRACSCGIAAATLLIIASHSTYAAQTCDAFEATLAKQIDAQGNRVAQPAEYKIAFKEQGNPDVRLTFSGIRGLDGNIHCRNGTDNFLSFDASASIDSEDKAENTFRIIRLKALAAAALCVRWPMSTSACRTKVEMLTAKAIRDFTKAKARGESSLLSESQFELPDKSSLSVDANEGTLSFQLARPLDEMYGSN